MVTENRGGRSQSVDFVNQISGTKAEGLNRASHSFRFLAVLYIGVPLSSNPTHTGIQLGIE